MNEFEWLRQTRALGQPRSPSRDLWSGIAGRIKATPRTPARAPRGLLRLPWALAAALAVLTLLVGGLSLESARQPSAVAASAAAETPWQPHDPRLSAAAITLDAAGIELAQALRQDPDARYLQGLAARIEQQRRQLQRLDHYNS